MRRNRPIVSRQSSRSPSGAIPLIILALVTLSLGAYAVHSLKRLPLFKVKDVIIREGTRIKADRNDDFRYLVGKNIFTLDLKKYAQFIQSMFPAYRSARLVRFLPDQVCVDLMKRTAVASINMQPPLYIDDHFIFFESIDAADAKGLPVIAGADTSGKRFSSGARCANAGVLFAVRVIRQAQKAKTLRGYNIQRVEVHDAANASLYFPGALEVRIGADRLDDALQILGSLLNQVGNGASNIEYIDLRFKDPVIRFKGKEA